MATTRIAFPLALAGLAALTISACASKPKPTYPTGGTGQTTTAPPMPGPGSGTSTAPMPGTVGQSNLPGTNQDFVVNIGDRVYFGFDSYDVRDEATSILDAQAGWLRRYPAVSVRIEGNTDELGTREYNLALGARRANAVRDYLVARGVTADRIATVSFGKEQPVDPGTGEESEQRNRNARTAIVGGAR